MFNVPEWATKEEWDAYAWFGFAIQEAQSIELMLWYRRRFRYAEKGSMH